MIAQILRDSAVHKQSENMTSAILPCSDGLGVECAVATTGLGSNIQATDSPYTHKEKKLRVRNFQNARPAEDSRHVKLKQSGVDKFGWTASRSFRDRQSPANERTQFRWKLKKPAVFLDITDWKLLVYPWKTKWFCLSAQHSMRRPLQFTKGAHPGGCVASLFSLKMKSALWYWSWKSPVMPCRTCQTLHRRRNVSWASSYIDLLRSFFVICCLTPLRCCRFTNTFFIPM